MLSTSNHDRTKTARQVRLCLAPLVCLAACVASLSAARTASEPKQISLYLNVEKNGMLVTGLDNSNFRLYVDGKLVPAHLEKPETPASIALLIEHSNTTGYYMDDIDAAISGFMKCAPEIHWYALASYSRGLTIDQDFTKMTGAIPNTYLNLGSPRWSEINTYDAVYEMIDKMGRLPGRRILIVVGTGVDTDSEHTLGDLEKKIEEENVVVFVAGAGSPFRGAYQLGSSGRMALVQAEAFLRMLAEKSGGFAWFPNQSNSFPDVLQGTMQSIESQYRLVYESPNGQADRPHTIRVEAFRIVDDKRENFKVLVRSGWR